MTPEDKQRAARALMTNPLFLPLLEEMRRDAERQWAASLPDDAAGREATYRTRIAVDLFAARVSKLAK